MGFKPLYRHIAVGAFHCLLQGNDAHALFQRPFYLAVWTLCLFSSSCAVRTLPHFGHAETVAPHFSQTCAVPLPLQVSQVISFCRGITPIPFLSVVFSPQEGHVAVIFSSSATAITFWHFGQATTSVPHFSQTCATPLPLHSGQTISFFRAITPMPFFRTVFSLQVGHSAVMDSWARTVLL